MANRQHRRVCTLQAGSPILSDRPSTAATREAEVDTNNQREHLRPHHERLLEIAVHKGSPIGPSMYETACGRRKPKAVETWEKFCDAIEFREKVAEVNNSGSVVWLVCPLPPVCWECEKLMPADAAASEDPPPWRAWLPPAANTP